MEAIMLIITAAVIVAVIPFYKNQKEESKEREAQQNAVYETVIKLDKKLSLEIQEAQLRIKVLEKEVFKEKK